MSSTGDSFETDRARDDQPERDDLIDPDDIDIDIDGAEPPADEDAGLLPDPEERPESQGVDVLDADRFVEDASARPLPSDDGAEVIDRGDLVAGDGSAEGVEIVEVDGSGEVVREDDEGA